MKYFASLIFLICLSWGIAQAQSPRFKLRPTKKKTTTAQAAKKNKKTGKKISSKTSITDRYRQKKNLRRKARLTPRNKARIRKTKN